MPFTSAAPMERDYRGSIPQFTPPRRLLDHLKAKDIAIKRYRAIHVLCGQEILDTDHSEVFSRLHEQLPQANKAVYHTAINKFKVVIEEITKPD